MYSPVNASFTSYIKCGVRGCKLHGQVSMMHCTGPITSVGEERAISFSAFACGLCNEGFPLPLCAWDGLCYLIVTYPWPSL